MGDSTPDEVLMAAYQAGNEAAFGQLFDRHAGRVYGFLVRRSGDRLLAEDLYQEVFLRLHRSRQTYDSSRPFRTWLYGIAHNVLVDALRSRGRSAEAMTFDDALGGVQTGNTNQSPEDLVALHEEAQVVERALATLPPDEATVLVLGWTEGLTYPEIGDVLGRSAAATKQLAYRALKRLRAILAPDALREKP